MADRGIKKVVVKNSQLPPINADTETYVVRYRIISEDRNRVSHWSPQYFISPTAIDTTEDEGISVVQTGGFLTVTWTDSTYDRYDVFVAWGGELGSVGLRQYFTTVGGQFATVPIRTSETTVTARVTIQRAVQPKQFIQSMAIAESSIVTLA